MIDLGTLGATASSSLHRLRRVRGRLLAAAVALFALLSLAPILTIALDLVGLVMDDEVARRRLSEGVGVFLDQPTVELLVRMAERARPEGSLGPTVVSTALALWAGSRLFVHVQEALNSVWEVPRPSARGLRGRAWLVARKRLVSAVMVLSVGVVLLASIIARAALAKLGGLVGSWGDAMWLWRGVELATSTVLLAALFAAIYRYVPDADVPWREAMLGGGFVSISLLLMSLPLGWYLAYSSRLSFAGVAKSILGVSVWLYVSSGIFFIGAALTRELCVRMGRAGVKNLERRAGVLA